jgi:serine/threonine protein kinase
MTVETLLDLIRKSHLIDPQTLDAHLARASLPRDPALAVETFVRAELLTRFQARHLLEGRFEGFIIGPYKVLEPIAEGGMGLVYLAEHAGLRRRVALKILRTELLAERGALLRFHREGRAAASLDHPNIVRVHDCGRTGTTRYLVMEYVQGRSLEDLLRRRGRLPVEEAVDYALQAARGLQHAHERGIIHRDVKPANLVLDRQGTVKILDMGLARSFSDPEDRITERMGGEAVLGSPDYIAPEQALGRLDSRSDIYSLGATLHALISGQPPFPGRTAAQKLMAHQSRPATPLHRLAPDVPPALSAVVLLMLAKDPEARYQSFAEVIAALSPWAPAALGPAANDLTSVPA